jgi:predicted short-subunit dehydrogenase-like oxidoreductase (DUF2520 family)
MKVICIGAGNVALHLSAALQQAGYEFVQVYSRSEAAARGLAGRLGCMWTAAAVEIRRDADLYVFSVKDDALPELLPQVPPNGGLWLHTAGSVPMDIFRGYAVHYGVCYPLQTFSMKRAVDFRQVPCFVEGASPADEQLLYDMAGSVSDSVQRLSSERRQYLHLAAVFACNFTNCMYALASRLVSEQGISPDVLLPLTDETAARIHALSPLQAQTGPAIRGDRQVIDRHLALLTDSDMRDIYQATSHYIKTKL